MVKPVVLVVEDEPLLRLFATDMIEEAGFSRVSVTNLSGGIAAIHHGWAI